MAPPPTPGDPSSRLRLALIAGLAGIALIFLGATIDALRLLDAMRAENKVLRDAALQRTNRLASIRYTVLLCHSYIEDPTKHNLADYLAKVRDASSQSSLDLASYRPSTLEEQRLVTQLSQLLDQHWQYLNHALTSGSKDDSQDSFIEITSQLQGIDGKQAAWTESQIEGQFEQFGSQLNTALGLGLAAALLLAAGSSIYILRIERQNRRRYQEVVTAHTALEQLSARLRDAQETERRTISRELHDQVGQTLNAVLVEAANLAKRIPADDTASLQYLGNIRKFADSSVNSIRDIALLLRPSMLDDLGLIAALEWQAREVSRRSGIKVTVTAGAIPDQLSDEMRTCIFRVVQEALTNVSRHSGAKCAVVTVRHEDNSLLVSVQDDGSGFDTQKTRGLGMLGMEERVRQLGGQLEIRSAPGKGTELLARLPIAIE